MSTSAVDMTPFVSKDTWKWCQENDVILKNGAAAQVGSIVICSDQGKDFTSPDELGKVLHVRTEQKLVGSRGKAHPDGDVGHLYVLTYKKQKFASKKKIECKFASHKKISLPVSLPVSLPLLTLR